VTSKTSSAQVWLEITGMHEYLVCIAIETEKEGCLSVDIIYRLLPQQYAAILWKYVS
jgi:peptide deformylase